MYMPITLMVCQVTKKGKKRKEGKHFKITGKDQPSQKKCGHLGFFEG